MPTPPKYEISLTITVRDAGSEDIIRLLAPLGDMAARGVIQMDPSTGQALRQLATIKWASWTDKTKAAKGAMAACGSDRQAAAQSLGISIITLDAWLAKARELEE